MKTPTEKLVAALHALANDIQSDDGVANAAIYEAAQRLEEQNQLIKRMEEAGDKAILNSYLPDRLAVWTKAKEAKL